MRHVIDWTEKLKRNLAQTYIQALAQKVITGADQTIYAEFDLAEELTRFDFIQNIHATRKIIVDIIREDNFGDWDRNRETGEILETEENISELSEVLFDWGTVDRIEEAIKTHFTWEDFLNSKRT